MEDRKIRVAITHGDTNGIGYELIFKTFAEPAMLELCTPIVYGSPKVAAYHRKAIETETNFTIINHASEAHEGRLNVLATFEEEVKVELGQPTQEAGKAAFTALEYAMKDYQKGLFDILVTLPVNIDTMRSEQFNFNSQTEYIESAVGEGKEALAMLVNPVLRLALATTRVPLTEVSKSLSTESIASKTTQLFNTLKRDFRISSPRVAVLALNPDNGEGKFLGAEEKEIIMPAIAELRERHIYAYGPYTADTFFSDGIYDKFDGVLAMYHEQGVTPFKLLDNENGVSYTAGLPIVRTSTTETPCYNIAGKGEADENVLRQAIYLGIDAFRNRKNYDEPMGNPLKKLYHERRDDTERVRFSIPKKKEEASE